MAKSNLAKLLKADLPAAAEMLRKRGRGRDSILAHITPREAAKLKAEGGRGSINPDTGLPEFEDGFFFDPTPIADQGSYFGSFEPPAITAEMFAQPTYAAPTQDYTFMSNPQAGFVQPFQAADYGIGFQPSVGSNEYAVLPTNQYAQMTPAEMARSRADVQNAYRTRGMPLPPDVAAKAYGEGPGGSPTLAGQALVAERAQQQALLPAYQTGSPEEERLTLAQLERGQVQEEDVNAIRRVASGQTTAEQENAAAKAQGKPGIIDKLGEDVKNNPMKYLIAALGLGALGLNYTRAQSQGKDYAQKIADAYGQAAAATRQLAQPFMQQGGQLLGKAVSGQLTAANQQQLEAARAQAAQQTARSGGVATAQAQRIIEDARQRLLANQQQAAISLLGAGTPLISTAIQQQLSGTTQGLGTQLQLSQQAGQAASALTGQLALLFARG